MRWFLCGKLEFMVFLAMAFYCMRYHHTQRYWCGCSGPLRLFFATLKHLLQPTSPSFVENRTHEHLKEVLFAELTLSIPRCDQSRSLHARIAKKHTRSVICPTWTVPGKGWRDSRGFETGGANACRNSNGAHPQPQGQDFPGILL